MQHNFAPELQRVLILVGVCLIFGFLTGAYAWCLVAGLSAYLIHSLWHIRMLDRWLSGRSGKAPPESIGIWDAIFDSIYRLQKRQRAERTRLQSMLMRVQEATRAFTDGVVLLDTRGNISWWNKPAGRLLGLRNNDSGQPLVNFLRQPHFVHYLEGHNYKEPLTIHAPHNLEQHLQVQVTEFGQNERMVVVRDVTRLHHLEEMRKDFVANVSHELRTPLTVINGYVETLAMSGDLSGPWVKALQQMEQQSKRMDVLINDLLTLTRLETNSTEGHKYTVRIAPMIDRIITNATILSGDKEQVFESSIADNLSLAGEESELESAISNLVYNAVKYTPKGSKISIIATRESEQLVIEVKDNGPGIDAMHIPRLTERFYRVDQSRNSATGGTGLGLAIVKHVLLRHNGTLDIRSKRHHGSSFICRFNLDSSSESE